MTPVEEAVSVGSSICLQFKQRQCEQMYGKAGDAHVIAHFMIPILISIASMRCASPFALSCVHQFSPNWDLSAFSLVFKLS